MITLAKLLLELLLECLNKEKSAVATVLVLYSVEGNRREYNISEKLYLCEVIAYIFYLTNS
jgi:hypothetical protein